MNYPHALWGSKMGDLDASKSEILDGPSPNLEPPNPESDPLPTIQANHFRLAIQIWDLDPKSQIWIQDTDSGLESGPGSRPQIQVQRGSQRRCAMRGSASNPFFVHQKIENPKMLRMKFWTSDVDTSKSSQNDLGTLRIGFALKNYAQKWSQIVKRTILAFLSDH